jgi:hypothetical protein
LGEPLTETQDSLVDSVLKEDGIVKSALSSEFVLVGLGQFRTFDESDEGAAGLVVFLDFFGSNPDFAYELLGGHEEVKEGDQGDIDGGEEGLFLKAREAVVTGIFADDGAIFLFDETVVVFLMVAAAGKGERFIFAPDFGSVIYKFGAVVAVELPDREEGSIFNVR